MLVDLFQNMYNHPDAGYYFLIPFISGIIGWVTNAVGVQMMFKPLEFVGIKPIFGWQGIIPARAAKFAGLQMDQVEKLIDIEVLLERVNPEQFSAALQPNLRPLVEEMVDDIAYDHFPKEWENLPQFLKKGLYTRVEKELPHCVEDMYVDLRKNFRRMFDAKKMVVEALSREKNLLVDLIQTTLGKELRFLIKSGLYFGFLFGIGQMFMFYLFPEAWYVLPIGGFMVGYATNWVAMKMLFKPLNPVKIGQHIPSLW